MVTQRPNQTTASDPFPASGDNFVRVGRSTAGAVLLWQTFLGSMRPGRSKDFTDAGLARLLSLPKETFWRHRELGRASPTVNQLPACLAGAGVANQRLFLETLIRTARLPFRIVPLDETE